MEISGVPDGLLRIHVLLVLLEVPLSSKKCFDSLKRHTYLLYSFTWVAGLIALIFGIAFYSTVGVCFGDV